MRQACRSLRFSKAISARTGHVSRRFCSPAKVDDHDSTPVKGVNDVFDAYIFNETPEEKAAREAKYNDLTETIELEDIERLEEDARILAANAQAIEDSKKFENRGKEFTLEERPFDDRENDPNPLSPDNLEVTDEILETIVKHAREMPSSYMEKRLITYGADKKAQVQNPNYDDEVKRIKKEQSKGGPKKKLNEDEELDQELQHLLLGQEPPKLEADVRSKYNLDLFENIETLLNEESYDPSAFEAKTKERELAKLKLGKQSTHFGYHKLGETSDEEDTIRTYPPMAKAIANKQNQPYIESFTRDGDLDPLMAEHRDAVAEKSPDVFSNDSSYNEFDEFRIIYGLEFYDGKDISPFTSLEAFVDSSGSSEDIEEFENSKETPLRVQADMLRLSGPSQETLWQLHNKDPHRFTIPRLASLFEMKPKAVESYIELKEDEKRAIKNGEETTNLEWWFVEDMAAYDYSKGSPIEIPYTTWMFGGTNLVNEKMDHRAVDEINIEKYREYDKQRIYWEKRKWKPTEEVFEFASQIIPSAKLDVPERTKSRYNYVFTDLTKKRRNLFKVYVREKEGWMRNATAVERLRGIKEERPHPNQHRRLL